MVDLYRKSRRAKQGKLRREDYPTTKKKALELLAKGYEVPLPLLRLFNIDLPST